MENTDNAVVEGAVDLQTEQANESTEVIESTESVESEVATDTEDIKQSSEENAKFADVRRKAEHAAQEKVTVLQSKLDALESSSSMKFVEKQAKRNNMSVDAYIDAVAKQEVNDEIAKIADNEGVSEEVAKRLYDGVKLQEKTTLDANTSKEKADNDRQLSDFVEKHPDVKEVPQEVWDRFNKGDISLSDAYDNHTRDSENASLKEQLAKYQENEGIDNKNIENAQASTGSVTGNGAIKSELTVESINKMSPKELMLDGQRLKK